MATETMLGRKIKRNSPAVMTAVPAPKMGGSTVGNVPKVPGMKFSKGSPKSVPTAGKYKFRPSVSGPSAEKLGAPLRG